MMLNYFCVLISFLVNIVSVFAMVDPNIHDSYNFIFFGDWGWNSFNQTLTAYEMGVYAWAIDSQFVVALGDNFYNDGVASVNDSLWASAFNNIYTEPALQTPWYPVLGNHDWHGSVQAQIDRSNIPGENRWDMPASYYYKTFEVPTVPTSASTGTLAIVFIDTQLLDPYQRDTIKFMINISGYDYPYERAKHLNWIDTTLHELSSSSTWLIVAGHYPIYSVGEHGDDSYLITDLLPLLLKHNVHAYLCAHDHMHEHIYKDGLHHITSGNGAGRGPFGPRGFQNLGISVATDDVLHWFLDCGFAYAQVTSDKFKFTFVDNFGVVRYSADLGSPHQEIAAAFGSLEEGETIMFPSLVFACLVIFWLSRQNDDDVKIDRKEYIAPPLDDSAHSSHASTAKQEV